MKTFSRRTFNHLIAAGVPLLMATGVSLPASAQLKNKRIQGVRFGAMSFSFFADMPKSPESGRVDNLIRAMTNLGLYDLEIMPDDLTPPSLGSMLEQGPRPPAQRRWWAETPLSHFEGVRRIFNDAGINVDCFMGNDWETDKELNRDFLIAKALGARYLGRPAGIERITRMARAAEKQNFPIYVHNETEHEDYLLAAMGVSPIVHINFDTGNYTAMGGTNHLEFMSTYHDRITHLHLKDRKRDGTCTGCCGTSSTTSAPSWRTRSAYVSTS
jgi:sugar phosphate isomerase/epimerase